jgi:hypothetical protein
MPHSDDAVLPDHSTAMMVQSGATHNHLAYAPVAAQSAIDGDVNGSSLGVGASTSTSATMVTESASARASASAHAHAHAHAHTVSGWATTTATATGQVEQSGITECDVQQFLHEQFRNQANSHGPRGCF